MAAATKDQRVLIKDVVHKLQLFLLHGAQSENQLFSAGTLMSRSDYQDVVTERAIATLCGYPLCSNPLPTERPRKGRYRISLKEHKVYDLQETYMFCSSACVVSSRAFAAGLNEDRCSFANPAKINEILRSFGDVRFDWDELDLGKNGDLGISKLKIQEKEKAEDGEVSLEDWVGPSNAIEGYVPKIDRKALKARKNESKSSGVKKDGAFINDMDFTSVILTEDEYSISKTPQTTAVSKTKVDVSNGKGEKKKAGEQFEILGAMSAPSGNSYAVNQGKLKGNRTNSVEKNELTIAKVSSMPCGSTEGIEASSSGSAHQKDKTLAESSSKSTDVRRKASSVTWADAQADTVGRRNLCEISGMENTGEGYVSQIDPKPSTAHKNESMTSSMKKGGAFINDMNFMSTIITEDEYSVAKTPGPTKSVLKTNMSVSNKKQQKKDAGEQFKLSEATTSVRLGNNNEKKPGKSEVDRSEAVEKELIIPEVSSIPSGTTEGIEDNSSGREGQSSKNLPRSSLKSKDAERKGCSVSWVDANTDTVGSRNLCDVREMENTEEAAEESSCTDEANDDDSPRFVSAEACALALSKAAEAVASGEADVNEAVSEAGIIILPPSKNVYEGEKEEETDDCETEVARPKWPKKPGELDIDYFASEDSWYDTPPDGFSLKLSTFATMWNALFGWVTSSSLAYIYGQEDSAYEEFLVVNGREYPCKVVLPDGRSSEIKQTLAGCFARALPGLVSDLRLPTPLSILEQGLGRLLDTMCLMDAVPSFRMKQWQVLGLLFVEALSVCRIPALSPHLTNRRLLLHKVLDGAQISVEEYEVMKDIVIPLGRAPQFSSQSGG